MAESYAPLLDATLKIGLSEQQLKQGNEFAKRGDHVSAVQEFEKGVQLLSAGGAGEIMSVLAELRISRALANHQIIKERINDDGDIMDIPDSMERCRCIVQDCTAVLELRRVASKKQKRDARALRAAATSHLAAALQAKETDLETARKDIHAILEDPRAEPDQKAMVNAAKQQIDSSKKASNKMKSCETRDYSIRPSFCTINDLKQVEGFHIGIAGSPRIRRARSFMDKPGPVKMSDGSPKQLAPGLTYDMTVEQINQQAIGRGAGSFFGELLFWKKHGGVLLGKQKWESEGEMLADTGTVSEIWDMRWVFKTSEDARKFFSDMLEASRAEGGNGFLDSHPEVSLTSHERSVLSSGIERDVFVMFASRPKTRPRNMNPTSSFAAAKALADPPAYSQQYGAVFCVDRVVVKLYAIEGFNQKSGPLKRASFVDFVNRAVQVVQEWWGGKRTGVDALSVCANCGKQSRDLLQCSRCKAVAYCNRDCQVAHYKEHKKPCRQMAASI